MCAITCACARDSFECVSTNRCRIGTVPIGGAGDASGTRPPQQDDVFLDCSASDGIFYFLWSPHNGGTNGGGQPSNILDSYLAE